MNSLCSAADFAGPQKRRFFLCHIKNVGLSTDRAALTISFSFNRFKVNGTVRHRVDPGGAMDQIRHLARRFAGFALSSCAFALLAAAFLASRPWVAAQEAPASPHLNQDALLDGYRMVEVASISDAAEHILGTKIYMSHRMQAIFPTKFAGYAVTVLLKKDEGNKDPNALAGMMAAIDQGSKDSVYVMTVEGGADIAGMGGLMGTAMHSRGYAGAVVDGGVRDVAQLKRIGFPVYALGPVPSTSVGHYKFGGANISLLCDGVQVQPGDIVAADQDGVVVVPRAKAGEILALAQDMDFKEHSMYPVIEKFKSLQEAVKQFGRL
jgi:regulator of RNase E activity RraA